MPASTINDRFGYHYQQCKRPAPLSSDSNRRSWQSRHGDYLEMSKEISTMLAVSAPVSSRDCKDRKDITITNEMCLESFEEDVVRLLDFPHEILVFIISYLDLGTAAFLSTTCARLYFAYKELHPIIKVPLSERCYHPSGQFHCFLSDMLEGWMRPRYRRKAWSMDPFLLDPSWAPPQYLNRQVYGHTAGRYGDQTWKKENALFERYMDYHTHEKRNKTTGKREKILPHPFNKGDEWYTDAKRAVFADAHTRRDWYSWIEFWKGSDIFKRIGKKEKLKVLQLVQERAQNKLCEQAWTW